jgi:hypothetical protein
MRSAVKLKRPVLACSLLVVLVAACAAPSGGSPSGGDPSPSGSVTASEEPSAEESASAPAAAEPCAADELTVDCFARVTADSLNLREEPSLDAPVVQQPVIDGDPIDAVIGADSGRDQVFIIDGPTEADGHDWYQVGVMNTESEQSIAPLFVGWVASGDGTDDWLVPEDLCSTGPVELADLTYANLETAWAIQIGCHGDEVLTLSGWFPELPPDAQSQYDVDGTCEIGEPAFLLCGAFNKDIRPEEMDFYGERSSDRLLFTVDPASGATLPERGQWIEITGAFDHPAAQECGPDVGRILECRATFVATELRPL